MAGMLVVAVLALAALTPAPGCDGAQLYAAAPQARDQYYRSHTGNYNYGYNTGEGSAKVEVKREDGSVVGSYRYFDPNGKQIVRSYIADSKGFRVLGNDLPISPETPAAAILGAPALTAPVEGASESVVESSVHPTKRQNTIDIENLAPPFRQYVVRTANPAGSRLATFGYSTRFPARSYAPSNTVEEDNSGANYYFYPFDYSYEFPAGFAYPGAELLLVDNTVVGAAKPTYVQQENVVVGRHRTVRPSVGQTIGIVGRRNLSPSRPFIIGKM